jgi:chromosome segregation ATPase
MNKNKSDKSKDTCSIEEEVSELRAVKDELSFKVNELQKEVHRLKIERDIYEKAAEIIKKKTRALIFKHSLTARKP